MTTTSSVPTSAASQTPAVTAPSTKDSTSSIVTFGDNFDSFLKLLTTQLQYQDPTAPLDTDKFTQQLIQFSSVEQQIQGNEKLDAMKASIDLQTKTSQNVASLAYVGQKVEVEGKQISLENGDGQLSYDLPTDASQITFSIVKGSQVLYQKTLLNQAAGNYTIDWDGKNTLGQDMPDGNYDVTFSGSDGNGGSVTPSDTTVFSMVDKIVSAADGTPQLHLKNGTTTTLDKVLSLGVVDNSTANNSTGNNSLSGS